MYFEIRKSKKKLLKPMQHYFVLKSSNNKVVMTSELYHNYDDMITTISAIKQGTLLAAIVDQV